MSTTESPTSPPSPTTRVRRVRHELKRRQLTVLRVASPSPQLRCVTLGDASLADFTSDSFDDHVKLIFDGEGADGKPVMRDYTPRRFDRTACELDIEFVLHGDGPAAAWAAAAQPGQHLNIGGPRGSFIVPTDFAWHLLIGDDTALPAIARRLEELPAGSKVTVLACARHASDRRVFSTTADAHVEWVDDDAALIAATQALALPAGEGYAWCAGEAATMAELRRILVDDKGVDRHAIRAAAYWKRGAVAHHAAIE